MRLHVVNPNASEAMTAGIAASARRAVMPGIDLIVTGAAGGPLSIEGPVDGARAVPWMLERIEDAEREGVDGHVIACFDDTGLDAARCLAGSPVVGIGEAAAHLASLVADRFAVVTSVPEALPVLRGNLVRYGLATRCAGLRAADIQVLDIDAGTPAAVAADPVARSVLRSSRMGPTQLCSVARGWPRLPPSLSEEFRCPVIEGIAAGLSLVSALAGAGLRTSKRGAYASPRAKVAR